MFFEVRHNAACFGSGDGPVAGDVVRNFGDIMQIYFNFYRCFETLCILFPDYADVNI